MRNFIIFLFLILFSVQSVSASEVVNSNASNIVKPFSEKNKWGLIQNEKVIVKPLYSKMVPLGTNNNSWIVLKGYRYGLIDKNGKFLIKPKYRNVDRYFQKYVKFVELVKLNYLNARNALSIFVMNVLNKQMKQI